MRCNLGKWQIEEEILNVVKCDVTTNGQFICIIIDTIRHHDLLIRLVPHKSYLFTEFPHSIYRYNLIGINIEHFLKH